LKSEANALIKSNITFIYTFVNIFGRLGKISIWEAGAAHAMMVFLF
jgi:hypothetical protein